MAIVDIKHVQTIEEAFKSVGEGGSSFGLPVVTLTKHSDDSITADKTFEDLIGYIENNQRQAIMKIVAEDGTALTTAITQVGSFIDHTLQMEAAILMDTMVYWDEDSNLMRMFVTHYNIFEDNHISISHVYTYWTGTKEED